MSTKRANKPIDQWTPKDWFDESVMLTNSPRDSDDVLCGAVMLAALREGPILERIADALAVNIEKIRPFFNRLRKNSVFTRTKVRGAEWLEDGASVAFCLDVCVGIGLLQRAKMSPKSKKIGGYL